MVRSEILHIVYKSLNICLNLTCQLWTPPSTSQKEVLPVLQTESMFFHSQVLPPAVIFTVFAHWMYLDIFTHPLKLGSNNTFCESLQKCHLFQFISTSLCMHFYIYTLLALKDIKYNISLTLMTLICRVVSKKWLWN